MAGVDAALLAAAVVTRGPPPAQVTPLPMCDPPTPAERVTRAALTALRLQTFTGVVWVEWPADGSVRVTSEGVSTFAPCAPPSWQVAHSRALQAVRTWGPLAAGRVCIQLRAGIPVG